jgi:uncharacterized membrane protein/protein-disulfide isomerase
MSSNRLIQSYWILLTVGLGIGLALQIFLVTEHFRLAYGLGGAAPLGCQIGAKFNCEAVTLSAYSEWLSVPLALWGALANALSLILFLIYLFSESRRALGFWGTFLGCQIIFITSLVMAGISHFIISAYCLYCMLAYGASFVAWVGSLLWLKSTKQNSNSSLMKTYSLKSAITGLASFLVLFFALGFFFKWSADRSYGASRLKVLLTESVLEWQQTPLLQFSEVGLLIPRRISSIPARMVLVEFIDLLCPACKFSSPTIFSFVRAKPDVDLIVKFFPLDGQCNASTEMPKGNGLRCQWSYAVHCAEKEGRGERALKWVFDQQETLSRSTFESQASRFIAETGLNGELLSSCMTADETKAAILKMSQEGLDARIRGTPSIFANGRAVSRGQNGRVLEEIYRTINWPL